MDRTTFGVLFRCGSSIGAHEHPGWTLKQITPGDIIRSHVEFSACQLPPSAARWYLNMKLHCWGKKTYASYSKSSLCFTSLKHSHPLCIFLYPPMFSSYAKFTFPPPSPFSNLLFGHCKPLQVQGHYSFWTVTVFSVFPILTYLLLHPPAAINISILLSHSVFQISPMTSRLMPEAAWMPRVLTPGTAGPPALAWSHINVVLLHNSHVCFSHSHRELRKDGCFPSC